MISFSLTIIFGLIVGACIGDAYLRIRKMSKQITDIYDCLPDNHHDIQYLLEQNLKNSSRVRYLESEVSTLRHQVKP
jgi:uncharacterized protein YneF (UPF0154 family)